MYVFVINFVLIKTQKMKIDYFAKCLLFFLFFSIFSCKDYDTIPCVPAGLKKNVVAFYPFTKGSIKDFSLDGRDLKMNGLPTPVKDRNGNANCAFSFKSSSNDNLSTNGSFTKGFQSKPFSISLWYQPQGNRHGGLREGLIERNTSSWPWSLVLTDCRWTYFSSNKYGVSFHDDSPSQDCVSHILDDTQNWHHVVCTFDGSKMIIYKDGQKNSRTQSEGEIRKNTGDIFIGKEYTGFIDDIILFNKALTDSEVQTLFGMDTCCQ